jgi:hypothetical protein
MANRKLLPDQFQDAEYQRRDMIARPEAGTKLDELLDPAYWANVSAAVRQSDRIEVRPADGSWWAELLVRAVSSQSVAVHVLRHVEFDKTAKAEPLPPTPSGYDLKYRGNRGWCVIRLADNQSLAEKQPTQEAAAAWLAGHLRLLAA